MANSYINQFISRYKCAADMLAIGLFPNAKEITESMSMYHAVKKYLPEYKLDDRDVDLFSVGDGSTPRTAGLFAFMTAWQCFSIDPNLSNKDWERKIRRLVVYKERVENIIPWNSCKPIIIVNVHSHAKLDLVLPAIRSTKQRAVVVLECCVKMDIPGKPHIGYIDQNVWSPMNQVKIWKDV